MKRNRVPAPRRKVVSRETINPKDWGGAPYVLLRLECGHIYHRSPANSGMAHIYCKKCLEK